MSAGEHQPTVVPEDGTDDPSLSLAVADAATRDDTATPGDTATRDDALTPEEAAAPKRGRHRRLRWIAVTVAIVLLLIAGGVAGGFYYFVHSVDSRVGRVQAFDQIPEQDRPRKAAGSTSTMNYLILGSDSRDPANTSGSRSDTIILLHLNKDHTSAELVSIPRDTWVYVPKSQTSPYGNTSAKINAAYAWGGIPLTVQTVERFTGIRIDHVVIVDFAGFKQIIDALGGVEINVERSFTSTHSLNADSIRHFDAGPQVMNGAAALDYARERYVFADGDFSRIRHQQQVIKAVLDKAAASGLMTNLSKLDAFLKACAAAITVDSTLNILSTAWDLRHMSGGNLHFYTNPSSGTGMVGSESVVFPDRARDESLFAAIRLDQPLPDTVPAY